MFRIIILTLLLVLFGFKLLAQAEVSGVVTGDDGFPLPGASVFLESDLSVGTVTDIDGRYALQLSDEQLQSGTLIFSFIGYKDQRIPISGQTTLNASLLTDSQLIDEAVVTAIGVKKDKKKLGYAVTEVGGEELQRSGEMNVMSSLNAKVAGVSVTSSSGTPGASVAVRIRGNKSVSGSNDPLYVIDGVPVDNTYRGSNFSDQANRMIDFNPDDIESITVLKGGAASALYGFRAANGAVLITTKKGKAGKTQIEFQSTTTFDWVNKLPQKQLIYGQGRNGEADESVQFSWGEQITGDVFDHGDTFFETGVTSDNFIGIRSGNDKSDVALSIGHLRQSGIIPNSFYNRTTLKLSGGAKLNDKWSAQASINLSLSDANRPQRGSNLSGTMLGLMRAPVDYDLTNGSDDPANDESAYQLADGSQRTYYVNYDNPYWSVNKNRNDEDNLRTLAYLSLDYQVSEHIKVTNKVSVDGYRNERKSYWDGRSAEFRADNGRIFNLASNQFNLNNDLFLTYNRSWDNWEWSGILGHNYFDYTTRRYELEGFGFIIEDFYDFSNTNIINGFADDVLVEQRGVGVYGDINVGYKGQVFLGFTGRNDWLSNLPVDNNNFFYPSASLGWVFSQTFDIEGKKFSYGKFRASWANTGNGAPGAYLTSDFFIQGDNVNGLTTFQPNGNLGSPDLKPENTTNIEAGFDVRLFQNRIAVDLTGYISTTSDPIVEVDLPSSTGYLGTLINGEGNVVNRGIELLINADVKEKGKWQWTTGFNFTLNRNEVESLVEGIDIVSLPSFGLASTQSVVIPGEAFGVLYGSVWDRDEQGNVLVNDAGLPLVAAERGVIGDPNPNWTGGWRNEWTYRNFSLTALFDIRVGGDMYNGTRNVMRFHGTHEDTENREETFVLKVLMLTLEKQTPHP